MILYVVLGIIAAVSMWCNAFHKKHHRPAPEVGGRWCGKCLAYYVYQEPRP